MSENGMQVYQANQPMQVINVEESLKLVQIAEQLFKSGLYPGLKSTHGAYAVIQYGVELGIPPMMALQNIDLIKGKPACRSQLIQALAIRRGVTYEVKESNAEKCTVLFKRGDAKFETSFTIEEAKKAGLISSGSGWDKFPSDMLFARCMSRGVRRIAPDALMGLYTIDEMSGGKWSEPEEVVRDVTPQPQQEQPAFNVEQELNWDKVHEIIKPWMTEVNSMMGENGLEHYGNGTHYKNAISRFMKDSNIEPTEKTIQHMIDHKDKFLAKFLEYKIQKAAEESNAA